MFTYIGKMYVSFLFLFWFDFSLESFFFVFFYPIYAFFDKILMQSCEFATNKGSGCPESNFHSALRRVTEVALK